MDAVHSPDNPFCSCFACLVELAASGLLTPEYIPMEDPLVHDATFRPFCGDLACPCHTDAALTEEHLNGPHRAGLITADEELRLFLGQQL